MNRRSFLKSAGVAPVIFSSSPGHAPGDIDALIAQHRHADQGWNDAPAGDTFWREEEGRLRAALFTRPTTVHEFGTVLRYMAETWAAEDDWLLGEMTKFADAMVAAPT